MRLIHLMTNMIIFCICFCLFRNEKRNINQSDLTETRKCYSIRNDSQSCNRFFVQWVIPRIIPNTRNLIWKLNQFIFCWVIFWLLIGRVSTCKQNQPEYMLNCVLCTGTRASTARVRSYELRRVSARISSTVNLLLLQIFLKILIWIWFLNAILWCARQTLLH